MTEIVVTNNLTKHFKGKSILNGLNLSLKEGHVYGLVGNNGAGKTTLMRILAGLSEPTGGSYSIFGGQSKKELCRARKRIGFLIDKPIAYDYLSIKRNLQLQSSLVDGVNKTQINKLREQLGITARDLGQRAYGNCSTGEKQRYGLASAFLGNPELLILDEPMNGLDPSWTREVRELLGKMNQEQHVTMLISSHIFEELHLLATDYLFLHNGELLLEITAKELNQLLEESDLNRIEDFFIQLIGDK